MISVIICTYNRSNYLYKTLESIAENKISVDEYEILLVDNNSTDDTVAISDRFHKEFPHIRYIYVKEEKQGLSHARNRGIQESRGDVLVFIDDDARMHSEYFRYLKIYVDQYPEMMAFGGRILPVYESRKEPSWLSPFLKPLVSALDKGDFVKTFSKSSYPIGANMGFRRSCIEQIGGFNTALGRSKKNLMGGEEKDICARIRQTGAVILYLPKISVDHIIPDSRTTMEYVRNVAYGIGKSEKIRCVGFVPFLLCLCKEIMKWFASILLWLYYMITFRFKKANALLIFRWNVSKGLISKTKTDD